MSIQDVRDYTPLCLFFTRDRRWAAILSGLSMIESAGRPSGFLREIVASTPSARLDDHVPEMSSRIRRSGLVTPRTSSRDVSVGPSLRVPCDCISSPSGTTSNPSLARSSGSESDGSGRSTSRCGSNWSWPSTSSPWFGPPSRSSLGLPSDHARRIAMRASRWTRRSSASNSRRSTTTSRL